MENALVQKVSKEVIDQVFDYLGSKIYKIILYGSYARGDFTSESDIDIMILIDCAESDIPTYRDRVNVIASRLSLENDVEVSLMLNDKDSFKNRLDILNFYQNIQKDGVVLYGKE